MHTRKSRLATRNKIYDGFLKLSLVRLIATFVRLEDLFISHPESLYKAETKRKPQSEDSAAATEYIGDVTIDDLSCKLHNVMCRSIFEGCHLFLLGM